MSVQTVRKKSHNVVGNPFKESFLRKEDGGAISKMQHALTGLLSDICTRGRHCLSSDLGFFMSLRSLSSGLLFRVHILYDFFPSVTFYSLTSILFLVFSHFSVQYLDWNPKSHLYRERLCFSGCHIYC